ncbi:hypothetical protein KHP62_13125 [Rhodobacteraceae bacterium NNCM2]|nr:hypothetical protein [Coraliihabitans acroporae]
MHEIIPVILGAIFGIATVTIPLPGPRTGWFIAGCVIAGALASWINGELESSLAGLFVSFDALLAWCGALSAVLLFRLYRTRQSN